jgi:predicted regulator of Ras-like GTPase activity (Roadblock/LC7/MglB family)
MSFEKVDGYLGHLVLKQDGAILASGGDLENDEKTASALLKVVSSATKGDFGTEVERISVNYAEHSYVIVSTNQKIHVIKRNTADIYE